MFRENGKKEVVATSDGVAGQVAGWGGIKGTARVPRKAQLRYK